MALIPNPQQPPEQDERLRAYTDKMSYLEITIATAWIYTHDLKTALENVGIKMETYEVLPSDRKALIEEAVHEFAVDKLATSQQLLKDATAKAAQVMIGFLDSEDTVTAMQAAKWILEKAHGKPGTSTHKKVDVEVKVKGYMHPDVNPDAWDKVIEGHFSNVEEDEDADLFELFEKDEIEDDGEL